MDETTAVTGDAAGNTYATGYFSSAASISGINLTVSGLTDIFVTKINSGGNTVWSVKAGGTGSDRGLGVAVDAAGNVIVCGFFTGTANFGNGVTLTANAGSQDAFTAKYDPNGNALWARAGGSSGNSDRANAAAVDNAGNVFVTGQFTGEAEFGAFSLTSENNTNDVFTVKYSPDGNELWAKGSSGNALNRGLGIAVDNAGAAYACGQFSGGITFDNTYNNTILNALFVVKYSSAGAEEWMRFAGGSAQSVAYDITTDGSDVYVTGDCGQSITFVNAPGSPVISTGYDNAAFAARLSPIGSFVWGSSRGSNSQVSSRGISFHNGQVSIAGWFRCTFDSLSDEYGEGLFNNMGFSDVFVIRFTGNGQFLWARQAGSKQAMTASGVHILPDNLEAVSGTFVGSFTVPLRNALSGNGLQIQNNSPNAGLSYCGDNNYGEYSIVTGSASDDGFLMKAIDLEREPLDFYNRNGMSDCDLSIPESCIFPGNISQTQECIEEITGCPGLTLLGVNFVPSPVASNNTAPGFNYGVTWSNGTSGISTTATGSGPLTATFNSADGCYSSSATVDVTVLPNPPKPVITDSQGVNTGSLNTSTVFICPGESVDLTAVSDLSGTWSGTNVNPDEAGQTTITATEGGAYVYQVVDEFGCQSQNFIFVVVYDSVPEVVDPFLEFTTDSDTLSLCGPGSISVVAFDLIEEENIAPPPYIWEWAVEGAGTYTGGQNPIGIEVTEEGWITVTVTFELDDDPCSEDEQTYQLTDSIYVTLLDVPDAAVSLAGPAALCQGDTVWLEVTTDSDFFFLGPQSQGFISGDSLGATGPGIYIVEVSETNEFGCSASASASIEILPLTTPQIFAAPVEAVICPGDSVLLTTDALGDITWLGPSGFAGQDSALYVQESGEYFVEVQFYPGCGLVSNTLQVSEYASPFLSASTAAICDGDSVTITVMTTAGSDITWLPPLSGNDPSQTISEPGEYAVEVTSCGITTQSTITVGLNQTEFFAEQRGGENTCEGDSILLAATPGMTDYVWNGTEEADSLIWVFTGGNYQAAAVDTFGCDVVSNVVTVEFEVVPNAPVFEFDPTCFGDSITVSVSSEFNLDWLAGAEGPPVPGNSEVLIAPFVADTVLYAVLSTEWCTGPVGQIQITPKPLPESAIPATDAPVCTGTSYTLSILNPEPGAIYTWLREDGAEFTGAEVSVFAQSTASGGLFEVIPELDGCRRDTAEIFVELIRARQVQLPGDTAVCEQSLFTLAADTVFAEYLWQDGSSDSLFTPSESGEFNLTVVDFNGCTTSADITIELVDCAVTIPNIFTPNGDGRNDFWVISVAQPLFFRVTVYNRWGRVVYESDDAGRWWDGNHFRSGEPCPEGVYFYVADIQSFEDVAYNLTGNLTLTRVRQHR